MPTRKVTLTLPDDVLDRLDRQSSRLGKSRSRFVAEQLDEALRRFEDDAITAQYDQVYDEPPARAENSRLAEDLLQATPGGGPDA